MLKSLPILISLVSLVISGFSAEASTSLNRSDFAKALGSVKPGMSSSDVVGLLGKPDDVQTDRDPGGITIGNITEIWGYGTDGHLSFPTLGCLYMNGDKVLYVFGGDGVPPSSNILSETDLRPILQQIDHASAADPLSIISAVNRLQPLGKDKAVAVLSEYNRVAERFFRGERMTLFLILRTLFDVPEAVTAPKAIAGAPQPPAPRDPSLFPRFPIALLDDVPLYLLYGYTLAGAPEPVEFEIQYFQRNGTFRSTPLKPTDNPLALLPRLESSPGWFLGTGQDGDREKRFLANQLLSLVGSVYRVPQKSIGCFDKEPFDQKRWNSIVSEVQALHIKWDSEKNLYTFSNGTCLP